MKVYQVFFRDQWLGNQMSWHATKREAAKEVARIKRDDDEEARKLREENPEASRTDREPKLSLVNVPTDKRGLLAWLNINCASDNG